MAERRGYSPDQGSAVLHTGIDRVVAGLKNAAQVTRSEVIRVPGVLKTAGVLTAGLATVLLETSPLMAEKAREPKPTVQALRLPSGRTATRGSGGETIVKDKDGKTVGYDAGRDKHKDK